MTGELATTSAEPVAAGYEFPHSFDTVDRGVGLAFNRPVAMLSLLRMASEPGKLFTATELRRDLNAAQGAEPGWVWARGDEGVRDNALHGLVSAGLAFVARKRSMYGEMAAAIGLTPEGLDWGVPLFGGELDRVVGAPHSLPPLFGSTADNAPAGTLPSPLLRLQVLRQTDTAGSIRISELQNNIPASRRRVTAAVQKMESLRVLTSRHIAGVSDRRPVNSKTTSTFPRLVGSIPVQIARPFSAPVIDLLQRVEATRHSEDYRKAAAEQAAQLIETPAAVAYLLARARVESSAIRTTPEDAQLAAKLAGHLIGWSGLRERLTFHTDWWEDAVCRSVGAAVFSPESERVTTEMRMIRRVCNNCPVRLPCLKSAVDNRKTGIWAGMSTRARTLQSPAMRALLPMLTVAQ